MSNTIIAQLSSDTYATPLGPPVLALCRKLIEVEDGGGKPGGPYRAQPTQQSRQPTSKTGGFASSPQTMCACQAGSSSGLGSELSKLFLVPGNSNFLTLAPRSKRNVT